MQLSDHFSLTELQGDAAEPNIVENLRRTALGLEAFRTLLDTPFTVTSGYRTVAHNQVVDRPMYEIYTTFVASDLPDYDQIEWCPFDGHVHFGFGERMRRMQLVKAKDGSFVKVSPDTLRWFPGSPSAENAE